jgi:hypothetical protein
MVRSDDGPAGKRESQWANDPHVAALPTYAMSKMDSLKRQGAAVDSDNSMTERPEFSPEIQDLTDQFAQRLDRLIDCVGDKEPLYYPSSLSGPQRVHGGPRHVAALDCVFSDIH